uniref:Uncharacterized protein n=1 Tax=Panagrolaimus davidi TaxID=227884 RepID=A0A914QQA9_9BILA
MKDGPDSTYHIDAVNPSSPEKIEEILKKYLSSNPLNTRNKRQLEGEYVGHEPSKKPKPLLEGELINGEPEAAEPLEGEYVDTEKTKTHQEEKLQEAEPISNSTTNENKEKTEVEKLASEKITKEAEKLAKEKQESERIAAEQKEKQESERLAAEKLAKEKQESERIAAEQKEKQESERLAAEKLAKEKQESERIAAEQKEKQESERLAAEKLAKEKSEAQKKPDDQATVEKIDNTKTKTDTRLLEGELVNDPGTVKENPISSIPIISNQINDKSVSPIPLALNQTNTTPAENLLEGDLDNDEINEEYPNPSLAVEATINEKDNLTVELENTEENMGDVEKTTASVAKTINNIYIDDNIYDNFFESVIQGEKDTNEVPRIPKINIEEGNLINNEAMLIDSSFVTNWKTMTEEEKREVNNKSVKDLIKILWDQNDYRFKLEFKNPKIASVSISPKLAYVLGFKEQAIFISNKIARYAPDLNGGINQFCIYSPQLAEPMVVGDAMTSLLRIVTIDSEPGKMKDQIYYNPIYNKVAARDISDIEIEIKTLTGEYVNFSYGPVIVTLSFKKSIDF